jgi:hypothetical protein
MAFLRRKDFRAHFIVRSRLFGLFFVALVLFVVVERVNQCGS